jgi:hypothetical protein
VFRHSSCRRWGPPRLHFNRFTYDVAKQPAPTQHQSNPSCIGSMTTSSGSTLDHCERWSRLEPDRTTVKPSEVLGANKFVVGFSAPWLAMNTPACAPRPHSLTTRFEAGRAGGMDPRQSRDRSGQRHHWSVAIPVSCNGLSLRSVPSLSSPLVSLASIKTLNFMSLATIPTRLRMA